MSLVFCRITRLPFSRLHFSPPHSHCMVFCFLSRLESHPISRPFHMRLLWSGRASTSPYTVTPPELPAQFLLTYNKHVTSLGKHTPPTCLLKCHQACFKGKEEEKNQSCSPCSRSCPAARSQGEVPSLSCHHSR